MVSPWRKPNLEDPAQANPEGLGHGGESPSSRITDILPGGRLLLATCIRHDPADPEYQVRMVTDMAAAGLRELGSVAVIGFYPIDPSKNTSDAIRSTTDTITGILSDGPAHIVPGRYDAVNPNEPDLYDAVYATAVGVSKADLPSPTGLIAVVDPHELWVSSFWQNMPPSLPYVGELYEVVANEQFAREGVPPLKIISSSSLRGD